MERDGLNISSLAPQSVTLNSVPYRASKIMAIAQENVRSSINPLAVLRRYICPSPHRRTDSITATAALCGFAECLLVIGMSGAPDTSLHPSGDEEHPKYNDETSRQGDRLDRLLQYEP